MKEFERFKKKMMLQHLIKSILVAVIAGLGGAALAILFFHLVAPAGTIVGAIITGVVFAGLGFLAFYKQAKPDDKKLALRLDKELNLHEKVATMVEFNGNDNIIAQKQREDAKLQLAAKPANAVKLRVSAVTVVAFALTAGVFAGSFFVPKNSTSQFTGNTSNWSSIVDAIHSSVDNKIDDNEKKDDNLASQIKEIIDDATDKLENQDDVKDRQDTVDDAKEKIDDAVDQANSKEEIGEALKTEEDKALQDLGQALIDGDNKAVSDALNELNEEFESIDDKQELADKMHDVADQIRDALEKAKEEGVDPNDGLYKSLENLANRLDGQAEKLENSDDQQPEQPTVFTYKTSYQGDLYFHDASFTAFDGKNWSDPIAYTTPAGALNPLYYTADKLAASGAASYSLAVDWEENYDRTLLPLHASTPLAADNTDAYLTEAFNTHQDYTFYPYALAADSANALKALAYSDAATTNAEVAYRSFAASNYLGVSAEEKAYFDTIIASENLSADIDGLLAAAAYIEGAAEYDIEYVEGGSKSYPEGENEILYFLQTEKKGVCVQFAGALTLLLRSMGVPARYTQGWQSVASGNAQEPVKVSNVAHAWTEAYIDNLGWVVLDATPASGNGNSSDPSNNNNNQNQQQQDQQQSQDAKDAAEQAIDNANKEMNEEVDQQNANEQTGKDAKDAMDKMVQPSEEQGDESDSGQQGSGQPGSGDQSGQPGSGDQSGKPTDQSGKPTDQSGKPTDQSGKPTDQSGQPTDQPGQPTDQPGQPGDKPGDKPGDQPGDGGAGPGQDGEHHTDTVYTPDGQTEYGDVINEYQGDAASDAEGSDDDDLGGLAGDYFGNLYGDGKGGKGGGK